MGVQPLGMTVQQFIEKHALSPVQMTAWMPAMFLMDREDDPQRRGDRYVIYTNAEKTIWVSLNQTRNRFRLCYCELMNVCGDWENADVNFELEPIATEPQPGM